MSVSQAFDPFRKPREDEPAKILWRERLEQRCRNRVAKERRHARERGRGLDGAGDEDMEEEGRDFEDDELIRRAVISEARRLERIQELAYARDVGSSIDPDMEDVDALEREIVGAAQEEDQEVSPPLSALDDIEADPAELYEAYLADIAEQESIDSLPPSSPPKPLSSPPAMSEDDFDMDGFELDIPTDSSSYP